MNFDELGYENRKKIAKEVMVVGRPHYEVAKEYDITVDDVKLLCKYDKIDRKRKTKFINNDEWVGVEDSEKFIKDILKEE